ncbi:MAG: galactose mutarotase [Clostridiales bacterium]|nr:galactose mutarotase [Clostridiales bacterium]
MSVKVNDYLSASEPEKYKGVSKQFVMTSSDGLEATILTYGALIEKLVVPDKDGKPGDIMLGLKGLDEYMASGANHGSIVGRSANRIAGASYEIGGVKYTAPANDGPNNLHGGKPSYQNVFWEGSVITSDEANAMVSESGIEGIAGINDEAVLLKYTSPDGACGFPGNLDTQVLYAWTTDKTLLILYRGVSDKDTIFAPTNHAYFNLGGHNSGSVKDHLLMIDADKVTNKSEYNVPDGTYMDVEGTIFDFRTPDRVEKVLTLDHPQTKNALGVDQNYCLNTEPGKFLCISTLEDPASGRKMETLTDLPGMQIYAGNHLGGNDQKGDIPYDKYYGICLEAQMYPNAVNIPEFASPVIKAGVPCYHACGYRFS